MAGEISVSERTSAMATGMGLHRGSAAHILMLATAHGMMTDAMSPELSLWKVPAWISGIRSQRSQAAKYSGKTSVAASEQHLLRGTHLPPGCCMIMGGECKEFIWRPSYEEENVILQSKDAGVLKLLFCINCSVLALFHEILRV